MTRLLPPVLLLLCACQGETSGRVSQGRGQVRGAVVARVQGVAIGLEQVQELAQATGLSPRDALSRLEDALLLEQRALASGYQQAAGVTHEVQRALVRALLAESIEAENPADGIPEADVAQRFESERQSLGFSAASYPEHAASLREHMAQERRRQALDKLVARLRAAGHVVLDEAKVQRLLADPKLWGSGK